MLRRRLPLPWEALVNACWRADAAQSAPMCRGPLRAPTVLRSGFAELR